MSDTDNHSFKANDNRESIRQIDMADKTKQVFISYSHRQQELATALAKDLQHWYISNL
ncbi:hypothetical protein Q757_01095 [Oenococcus alcoholitolerans]|uniref:TIR domain-containing protein n=1 Tax=Oenococcus alcoholitolerans TaxID=931074 RepID=A0ABR4XTP4_9LACO|nr:hypothetical protein Q757_01095 [Oenococcus alcoholitolerans]